MLPRVSAFQREPPRPARAPTDRPGGDSPTAPEPASSASRERRHISPRVKVWSGPVTHRPPPACSCFPFLFKAALPLLCRCSRKRSRGACGLRPVPTRRAAALLTCGASAARPATTSVLYGRGATPPIRAVTRTSKAMHERRQKREQFSRILIAYCWRIRVAIGNRKHCLQHAEPMGFCGCGFDDYWHPYLGALLAPSQ